MNDLSKESMVPSQAIIVFQGNNDYYLETREILKDGVLGAGVPLERETLSRIMQEIETTELSRKKCTGFLPNNLLLFREESHNIELIWYVKASKRQLSFKKSLGIDDGLVNLPTLVFHLKNGGLNVYATKINIPTTETKLYRAPLHNINLKGDVCMGSSKVKSSDEVLEIILNNEDGFFMSMFTELHGGSPIKGNLNTFLQKQIKGNLPFDNNVLTPSKVGKVKDLV
jgi:PRTRC genetic system protein B